MLKVPISMGRGFRPLISHKRHPTLPIPSNCVDCDGPIIRIKLCKTPEIELSIYHYAVGTP